MSAPIILPAPDLLSAFAALLTQPRPQPEPHPSSDWDRFDAEMRAQRERRGQWTGGAS